MNLIALYGPPAVGKLTVTKELVRLTGYTRFDNHRIVDVVVDFFDFESEPHMRLLRQIQVDIFKAAAGADHPGVVYTFLYEEGKDHPYLQELTETVQHSGGRACFVRLHCEHDQLLQRVGSESRQSMMKLTSPEILESLLPRYGTDAEVPFGEHFTVDTGRFSPAESAAAILTRFVLP